MPATHLDAAAVHQLLTQRSIAAIGSTGSGIWDLSDAYPQRIELLEAEDLNTWHSTLLVLHHSWTPPQLEAWLTRHCPAYDHTQLRTLAPHAAILVTSH